MKIKCPDCNCTAHSLDGHYMAKLKGIPDKVQRTRVKCKRCGRRYTMEDTSKNNPPCVYCDGKTRKVGFDLQGRRKYKCTHCFTNFTEGVKVHRLTEHQKKMVVVYASGGYSKRFIAKLLGVSATHVDRLIKKEKQYESKTT